MPVQRIIESLNEYTGDANTLDAFVQVVTDELGSNWTEKIYDVMKDVPPSLKEKLDHAFNYYAATTAWNEIQSYIAQADPLNYNQTIERIPVLEHWLSFFGAAGEEAVSQLQSRLRQEASSGQQDTHLLDEPFPNTQASSSVQGALVPPSDVSKADFVEEKPEIETAVYEPIVNSEQENVKGQSDVSGNSSDVFLENKQENTSGQSNISESNSAGSLENKLDISNEKKLEVANLSPVLGVVQEDSVKIPSNDSYRPAFMDEDTSDEPLSEEELTERINDIFSISDENEKEVDFSVLENTSQDSVPVVEVVQPEVNSISQRVGEVKSETDFQINPNKNQSVQTVLDNQQMLQDVVRSQIQSEKRDIPLKAENESQWRVNKIFKQIDFVVAVQAWISGRCHDLGYTDYYTYRYYGFLVDVMDTTIVDLKSIVADMSLYDLIEQHQPNGVQFLKDQITAFEKQSKEAHDSVLSDLSPLPREDLSADDLRRSLGAMDTSSEKEYLGPAPDGFEVVDDPYAGLSDETLEQEYAKIEQTGSLPEMPTEKKQTHQPPKEQPDHFVRQSNSGVQGKKQVEPKNQSMPVNNASQTAQNGVQRKMSFNFGPKKPSGTGTTGA